MKNQPYINNYSVNSSKEISEPIYVGYVNGRLTRFVLWTNPKTKQVIKLEIAKEKRY